MNSNSFIHSRNIYVILRPYSSMKPRHNKNYTFGVNFDPKESFNITTERESERE